MSDDSFDDLFSDLNIGFLKNYVKTYFLNAFVGLPISKITLYRYFVKNKKDKDKVFALIFRLGMKRCDFLPEENKRIDELDDAAGFMSGVGNDQQSMDLWHFDGSFVEVYKKQDSAESFLKKWHFFIKRQDESIPEGCLAPVTIFPNEEKKEPHQS